MVTDGVITDISVMAGLPTAIPEGSYILRTHGRAEFVKQNLAIGQRLEAIMLWCPKIGKELDPSTLQMMIGGHTILVDNGKATSFSRNVNSIGGSRARQP